MLQRQAESQRFIADLRAEHSEVQLRAKEWQDKYKDLENVHYHSGHNSSGTPARLTEVTRDSGADTIPLMQAYPRPAVAASQVEPPPRSYWPRSEGSAARESLQTGQTLVSSAAPTLENPLEARVREPSAETRAVSTTVSGAEQPRTKESETVSFEPWPSINNFRQWRMSFRREISSSSTKPTLALAWASEIDEATDVDQLRTSVLNHDGVSIDFETVDRTGPIPP